MNNNSILIVDDEEEVLGILESFLRSKGFEVVTANSGSLAIEKAKIGQFDLILLDIILPDVDGPDVARALQCIENANRTPILFLSGIVANPQEKKSFSQINVDGKNYNALGKPFALEDLLFAIKSLLNQHENPPLK